MLQKACLQHGNISWQRMHLDKREHFPTCNSLGWFLWKLEDKRYIGAHSETRLPWHSPALHFSSQNCPLTNSKCFSLMTWRVHGAHRSASRRAVWQILTASDIWSYLRCLNTASSDINQQLRKKFFTTQEMLPELQSAESEL